MEIRKQAESNTEQDRIQLVVRWQAEERRECLAPSTNPDLMALVTIASSGLFAAMKMETALMSSSEVRRRPDDSVEIAKIGCETERRKEKRKREA